MLKYEKTVLQNTIDTKLTGMYNSKLTVADGCTIDVSKSDFYPTSDAIEKINQITSGQSFTWNYDHQRWIKNN